MKHNSILLISAVFALLYFSAGHADDQPSVTSLDTSVLDQKWTDDLDSMIKRRVIRVLVVYNNTHYFIDKGNQYGITYEFGKAFEEEINKKYKTGNLPVHVAFVPVSREGLLQAIVDGRGDIAAANLTVTPERQKLVDFSRALRNDVNEIIVSGPGSPSIHTLEDLGGKEVYVRPSSSYHESLLVLNEKLQQAGKPEVIIMDTPENLEDESLLEMLNAGLIKFTVVDNHIGEFWAQILPDIHLHPDLKLREGGEIAVAFRKNSPQLARELDKFLESHIKGTLFGNVVLKKYLKSTQFVKNAASEEERKKFLALIDLFKKYGNQYGLDWLLMAAQGYQESQLDQSKRNPSGAVGVMQVLPSTGNEMGVGDIHLVDPNIHAGVKYIRYVIDQYFKDEPMDELDKTLFAFASYNAGPARIRKLRAEAKEQGLDPNKWFGNVEYVVSNRIGRETVVYVSNVYKYYIAYRLVLQERERQEKAAESMQ